MKKIYLLLLLLWQIAGWSQDTTGYDLLANYPFQSDAVDATGNNGDAAVQNAPFTSGSIYSNGTYNDGSSGQTGSLIVMNGINGFNTGDFMITFDAKLSSNTNNFVFVCGNSYRWLDLWVGYSHTLQVDYLTGPNADFAYSDTNFAVTVDQWYHFGLKYTQSDHNLKIYADNNLIGTVNIPAGFTTDNQIYFSNTHSGAGATYNGYWRNVKYYIPHNINGIEKNIQEYVSIYQDKFEKLLHLRIINTEKITLQIYDLSGKMVKKTQLQKGNNLLDMNQFSSGMYIVKLLINQRVFNKKFILN